MKYPVKELLNRIWNKEEKGQTLIEYALIVLLIAIVVIVVLGALGGDVTDVFTTIRTTFSGASS
jgi:pilus assembly protein Flp/PilA